MYQQFVAFFLKKLDEFTFFQYNKGIAGYDWEESALNRKYKIALISLMAVALLASFYILVHRVMIEQNDTNVDVAVEWTQMWDYAQRQGLTEDEALEMLQGKVTAIVFKERLFSEVVNDGRATAYSPVDLRLNLADGRLVVRDASGLAIAADDISLQNNYYAFSSEVDMETVVRNLEAKRLGEYKIYTLENSGQTFSFLETNFPISSLSQVGVGFDQEAMEKAASFGFGIIPQFRGWAGYEAGDMAALLEPFAGLSVSCILFNDATLPGMELEGAAQTAVFKDMALGISTVDAPVATIEFYSQNGLSSLVKATDTNMVRLHVITDNEMIAMTQDKAMERYLLAVNERNIRILFVKFFSAMDFDSNLDFIGELGENLTADGFTLATTTSIPDVDNNIFLVFLIALGVAAAGIYLMNLLHFTKAGLALAALLLLGVAGLFLMGRVLLATKGLALLAALIFPTLGVYRIAGEPRSLGRALVAFFTVTGISLVGAAYVVGLLGDKVFMLRLDAFSGTKLALGGPIVLLFLLFILFKEKNNPWQRAGQLSREPVRYGYLLLAAIFCGVMLVFLLRSGNDNMSVSNFELLFRAKLEDWLVVRPRTKEFALGHPAMLLALYYGYKDKFLLLWIAGAIGQVSIINTFSHIHTPILISVLRTFNGIWTGLLIGIAVLGLILLVKKYHNKLKIKGNGVL